MGVTLNLTIKGGLPEVHEGNTEKCRNFFSETCDERALPLVGSRSESAWKAGSRGGVAGGWNAAGQSLVTWYIPGQTVQMVVLLRHQPNR